MNLLKQDSIHNNQEIALGEEGQTLVEFVLLITIIMAISFTFMSFVNRSTISLWERAANLLLEDPSVTLRVQ